ncbi:chaperone NapD [Rhizobium daejeonense]|uniref:Chaperone NapD n=1 Tax=Rhizobium daejeonense TaxID=240521 RepID=A0A6M1S9U4_9HYPH|nr:chaperone NapD [Rhizobium daejeonense]NGO65920.1 chaperone NapD [Rhizobium daejeonense]
MPEVQHHISSAIVITRAEHVEMVAGSLQALEGVEVHATAQGKIVIVIEGPTAGHLGEMLLRISAMDDVIAAHMVFEQAIVEQEMSDDGRTHAA